MIQINGELLSNLFVRNEKSCLGMFINEGRFF